MQLSEHRIHTSAISHKYTGFAKLITHICTERNTQNFISTSAVEIYVTVIQTSVTITQMSLHDVQIHVIVRIVGVSLSVGIESVAVPSSVVELVAI